MKQPGRGNPMLALPAAQGLRALPAETHNRLRSLLLELGAEARARADLSWRRHKAPMAAYWKAVSVYARHTARALR